MLTYMWNIRKSFANNIVYAQSLQRNAKVNRNESDVNYKELKWRRLNCASLLKLPCAYFLYVAVNYFHFLTYRTPATKPEVFAPDHSNKPIQLYFQENKVCPNNNRKKTNCITRQLLKTHNMRRHTFISSDNPQFPTICSLSEVVKQ